MSTDTLTKPVLHAHDVAHYLRQNSSFLTEFPDLALLLKLPRQSGQTTSLASYQLDVLRDKNYALNRRLQELITVASENEQLVIRVHAFTLALMRARSLDETLQRMVATLREDFHSELVRVVLFQTPLSILTADWLQTASPEAPHMRPFAAFFAKAEPLCGRISEDKLDILFAEDATQIKSAVLLPISTYGLIAIGSPDANRFYPGMGILFLKLIADAIHVAIARYQPERSYER